jgi:hypothetical protein
VRDRGQDGMVLPTRPRAPFEVVEAELAFQFLILLLDRPAELSSRTFCKFVREFSSWRRH